MGLLDTSRESSHAADHAGLCAVDRRHQVWWRRTGEAERTGAATSNVLRRGRDRPGTRLGLICACVSGPEERRGITLPLTHHRTPYGSGTSQHQCPVCRPPPADT
jgi:hypothetical protein